MVSPLATRCLGGHLTTYQHDQWPGPHVNLTQSLICGWMGICDVYYFYTHLKLWRLIYLFILLYFFTYFFIWDVWPRLWVKQHGMADEPYPQGRHFIEMLQNIFLKYISFSIPPIFFNIVNVSGIDIHLKFTYLYNFYLNMTHLDGYISLHIDLSGTYFLSGNF